MESVLLLLLLGTWATMYWLYRRLTREIDDLARERVQQTEVQGALARMATQLQEAADELAQAMSARSGRLQELLGQADRRIAAVDAALTRLREAEFSHLTDVQPVADANNGANVRLANAVSSRPERTPETAASAGMGPAAAGLSGYEEVRRLAAQGLDEAEIAQRTHRGREEVRLLLRLTQAAQSNGRTE
jgi:hypothetical protein